MDALVLRNTAGGLELQVIIKMDRVKSETNNILARYRPEIAPLTKYFCVRVEVLDLLYFHSGLDDKHRNLVKIFARRHAKVIQHALDHYQSGVDSVREWIRQQEWPEGYNINKFEYIWRSYLYGYKPAIERLLKAANE